MKNSRCILVFPPPHLPFSLGALCLFILLFSEQQYLHSTKEREPICERLKLLFRVFMERR
jgi:hypothetical protein